MVRLVGHEDAGRPKNPEDKFYYIPNAGEGITMDLLLAVRSLPEFPVTQQYPIMETKRRVHSVNEFNTPGAILLQQFIQEAFQFRVEM